MLMTTSFETEALPLLPELRSAARRFAGSRRDMADDLFQETWLRAIANSHRYRPGTNARAWMYAILANAARSAFRRERRDVRLQERYGRERAVSDEPSRSTIAPARPESSSPRRALSPSVMLMLEALPESYRRVVELVDLEGLSYREVAQRLDCPVGTVMSRLHRGRRQLRVALTEAGEVMEMEA